MAARDLRCRLTYRGAEVNFAFSDEQEQLRESVRRFLADKSPMSEVRRLMETPLGYDPAVWAQMAGQLGLLGLAIPEEHGGSGFGFTELAVVLEEMGRTLFCAPYFSTAVLATAAILAAADDEHKKRLLPGLASGQVIAALAVAEDDGRWDGAAVRLEAMPSGDHYLLNGHKTYVLDGHIADLVITVGRIGDGLAFFAVEGDAEGLERRQLPTLDMTRAQARIEFRNAPGRLIGSPQIAENALARTLDVAAVGLAAEMVGGAQHCLDISVSYAKNRTQFGRPIGSFQAIKHKCANMLLQVESARSAAYYAAWAAGAGSDELAVVASLVKAHCSEAYFYVAGENIQIHGGIGFTWEHDAHLYFKRAKSSELLFGDPPYHRELLAQRIGI
jgi:alkylation response protein AidB-like acyl-CoA dehydrogenase